MMIIPTSVTVGAALTAAVIAFAVGYLLGALRHHLEPPQ